MFGALLLVSSAARGTVSTGTGGEGVTVGNSSLISTVQMRDTFTFSTTSSGLRNGVTATAGAFPLSGVSANNAQLSEIESAYHASATPSSTNEFQPVVLTSSMTSAFSLDNDAVHYTGTTTAGSAYPGTSGAGSASGFTQTGMNSSAEADYGIFYGQSNNFLVQIDAVQLPGRVVLGIGSTVDATSSAPNTAADGLAVYFNGGGTVGLFNKNVNGGAQMLTTLTDTLAADKWNNYAVGFNLTTDTLSIYGNETLIGTVNLATFDGGLYAAGLDASSANYITVGGETPAATSSAIGLLFTDNFEVGLAPEPSSFAMLALGVAGLCLIARRRIA